MVNNGVTTSQEDTIASIDSLSLLRPGDDMWGQLQVLVPPANTQIVLRNAQRVVDQVFTPRGIENYGVSVQGGMAFDVDSICRFLTKNEIPITSFDIPHHFTSMEAIAHAKKVLFGEDNAPRSLDQLKGELAFTFLGCMPLPMKNLLISKIRNSKPYNNNKLDTNEKPILRAYASLLHNGRIDELIRMIEQAGYEKNGYVIAIEPDSTFESPALFYERILQLSQAGLPLAISFDGAGISRILTEQNGDGSIVDAFSTITSNSELLRLLAIVEVDPFSQNQRHANILAGSDDYIQIMNSWRSMQIAGNGCHTPHFIIETDPRDLDELLGNNEVHKYFAQLAGVSS